MGCNVYHVSITGTFIKIIMETAMCTVRHIIQLLLVMVIIIVYLV